MISITSKKAIVLSLIVTGLTAFSLGLVVGEMQITCKICPPEEVDFSLFWETWDTLHQKYVNPEKLETKKMIYGAISGMVNSLDDPYTVFLKPDEAKKFKEDTSGRFEGIGMEVGTRKGVLQVIAPIKGTPAEKAGLKAGDKIFKIDGVSTEGISLDDAVSRIRGQKGTKVILTIFREGWEKEKDFTIEREIINVPSLEWELKDIGNGEKIAYIKLYQFSEKAGYDFSEAAWEILDSPSEKIILDLRNNPGGYLEVAQEIAGWFLEKGKIVVIEEKKQGEGRLEYKSSGNARLSHYPIVVLINEGSASGSEILAGALRDNRNVKLIGETSFGKGSVQQLEELSGGSSIKITVAKWLTPKGASISEVGLEPDVEVEITEEDEKQQKDPQLDKAIEILRELR